MGVRTSLALLDDWPEEKIRRFRIVMQQVDAWEEAQIELARRKASASATGGRGA